jgi:tetratricopeptide (TPR) repeat protein
MDVLAARLQPLLGDRYRLTRELPGGGMSRVFLAHEPALKRDVVVKVLPPDLLTARSRARFAQEMEVTARLQHPHILPVLSSGGGDDLLWYVTPYVRGASLRERLAGEMVPLDEGLALLADLAGALRFAHERGVLHRDLKPGNVLLAEGHAILADFGIARALTDGDDPGVPAGSTSIGTTAYAPPGGVVDEAGDLYAMGRLAHQLLLGELPREAATDALTPERVRAQLMRRHAGASAGACLAAATVVAALLAPRGNTLGGSLSAAAVERQLRGAVAGAPTVVPAEDETARAPVAGRPAGTVAPKRRLWWALAGALVVGAASAGGWMLRRGPEPGAFPRGMAGASDVPVAAQVSAVDSANAPLAVADTGGVPAATLAGVPTAQADSVAVSAAPPASRTLADSMRALVDAGHWVDALPVARAALEGRPADAVLLWQTVLLASLQQPPETPGEEPRVLLGRLAAVESALSPDERALAEGYRLLARGSFPEAVAHFRQLRLPPALAPWALVGIAEALSRDVLVVPDAQSLSGYRFRTDRTDAMDALAEAMRSAPWVDRRWVVRHQSRVAPVEPDRLVAGRDADGARYVGRVEAVGDRVVATPYRAGPGGIRLPPPSAETVRAVAVHRERMATLLAQWRRESPREAAPWLATATLLEAGGYLTTADEHSRLTALEAMARGRTLLREGGELPLVQQRNHVRLYLRAGRFAEAAALADSALADIDQAPLAARDRGVPFAFLTGRTALATRLAQATAGLLTREVMGPAGMPVAFPVELLRERATALGPIVHGLCTEAVREAPARLRALADARVPSGERAPGFEAALLQELLELALPCLGAEPLAALNTGGVRRPTSRGAEYLVAGTPEPLVAMLAQVERSRQGAGAPPLLADEAVALGVQLAAAGDTAAAYRLVTRALEALPVANARFAEWGAPAGSLGRGMLLAAEWGVAVDPAGAARWLAAVEALWARADAPLRAEVARVAAVVRRARATPLPAP